ncbi:type II toxin-antitoxin system PemK/MazF family toxin [Kocuria sp. cx-455]|uniref:type II toxin-antitoxin system PemK/MazF family toxin n=1 Tax=unclassified Candidatus Sulfotelmatobacter TaxID=2635724 RepID=UPI0016841163|nr:MULTISPECIES: type II toxin-antitoxin system PemK/MazF family toxin [unclassified Candidatus Sulfotelmatobacter]MBD2761447.1 type II toxin-antitoxin system PemK/MazF family toxin [Kocuria sp. cx-116]MBD2765421.1 type II toxin-antitoxin system PemK/MazF family toxin [Kocuria sp. cx-455]
MADFMRLARQGLRAYRMYKRVSGSMQGNRGQGSRPDMDQRPTPQQGQYPVSTSQPPAGGRLSKPYLGDWTGPVNPQYNPRPDGRPDPGEVVWTWVPFQEDHTQGKDRPVLIVDRAGDYLLCLMLTSKDHDHASYNDPDFVDVGTGPWDRQGRPSEARLNRVIPVLAADIRREGAVLGRHHFDAVTRELGNRR